MARMATARYYPGSFEPHPSKPLETRSVAYLALGVAAVSAISVFFLLCQRDHSLLLQASLPETGPYVSQNTPAVPAPSPAIPANQIVVQESAAQPRSEYIPFNVARSRRFQRVGPISVGVWRTDARHGTYDVGVLVDGRRFDKRHVGMDEALAIRVGNAPPMELVVNRVSRNDISGYLSAPRPLAVR